MRIGGMGAEAVQKGREMRLQQDGVEVVPRGRGKRLVKVQQGQGVPQGMPSSVGKCQRSLRERIMPTVVAASCSLEKES